MRNNYLVLKEGKLVPNYTVRERFTNIIVATVADLEIALKLKGDNKDIIIFDESLNAEVF